jgi:hypothetical protein
VGNNTGLILASTKVFAVTVSFVMALSACAPAIRVQSAQMATSTAPQQLVRVVDPVVVQLSTGYSREVRGGSTWRSVGVLPQGMVFRPVGTVFTIEGRQVHEAYLVINANTLVGFFLPGESSFSALQPSQPIKIEKIND